MSSPSDQEDRQQIETALREQEEERRIIMEGARCLLWRARVYRKPDGKLLWQIHVLDEAAATRFLPIKRQPGQTYAEAWVAARPPEDRRRMAETVAAALAEGRNYRQEFRCWREDGTLCWLAEDVVVERVGDGEWRCIGVCLDVTERRRTEEALRQVSAHVRCILWQGEVHLGEDQCLHWGQTTVANEAAVRHYFPVPQAPGQSFAHAWWRARLEEDRARTSPEGEARIRRGESYYQEYRVRLADDRIIHLGEWVAVESVGEGHWCCAAVCVDVTELREIEAALRQRTAELEEADRRKDHFLAMLAHELRNPLGTISNALHILGTAPAGTPAYARAQAAALRQVEQQSRLVDDLLDVSRITRGRLSLRKERVDLARLVEETAGDHQGIIEARGITFTLRVPDRPVPVWGDPTRLTQVLGNLLDNAAKFTPAGQTVTVELVVTPADRMAAVVVRDTGCGIEPMLLAQVFEPFTQADRSLDRSAGGLGLGLALAKGLVELHDGRITGTSHGLGQGAAFQVELPLVDEPPAVASAPAMPARRLEGMRVLLIEDNPDAAESLADLLALLGCQVRVAATGPQGVAMAREAPPQVVLCDIGLPGMNGFEVARELRGDPRTADSCLVAVTGYGGEEEQRRSLAAGFAAHLVKPVDLEALQGLLQELRQQEGPAGMAGRRPPLGRPTA